MKLQNQEVMKSPKSKHLLASKCQRTSNIQTVSCHKRKQVHCVSLALQIRRGKKRLFEYNYPISL